MVWFLMPENTLEEKRVSFEIDRFMKAKRFNHGYQIF